MNELHASPSVALWLVVLAVPILFTVATSFTKSTIVLGALRVGLGAEAILPAPALFAVALVITGVVMGPTLAVTLASLDGGARLPEVIAAGPSAWQAAASPLLDFLARHASSAELEFFAGLQTRAQSDALVIVPAFLVTELTEALSMAVLILVPLLVLDLVVAQALVLIGLVNQPPAAVTIPIKLLLFLSAGGWDAIVGGLVEGYR